MVVGEVGILPEDVAWDWEKRSSGGAIELIGRNWPFKRYSTGK